MLGKKLVVSFIKGQYTRLHSRNMVTGQLWAFKANYELLGVVPMLKKHKLNSRKYTSRTILADEDKSVIRGFGLGT
jgi:hypothetical protein